MPRNLAAIVSPEAQMTEARLRELLNQEHVVKGEMTPPSQAAYERLAILIDLFWIDARQVDASRHDLARNFEEIVDISRGFACKEMSRPPVNLLGGTDWRRIGEDFAALNLLLAGIRAVQGREFFQAQAPMSRPRKRKGSQWHKYARDLQVFFVEAMEEANPGSEIRLADDGPVSRFIAAVIPFITGERPKPTAIARHLQRPTSNNRGGFVASNILDLNVAD